MMAKSVIIQIKEKDLVLRYGDQGRYMLVNGKMIDNTGLGDSFMRMENGIRVISSMIKQQDEERFITMMDQYTKGISEIINLMVLERKLIATDHHLKENLKQAIKNKGNLIG